MAKRIALFNHKGGVSKTTTTFNLGWMLASKGKRVVLVDTDPQSNLTGLALGYGGYDDDDNQLSFFYERNKERNLKAGLAPAFESRPSPMKAVDCVAVDGCNGLFLLPGHIELSEYEVTLGIAQELSGSIQTLQNLPGSISVLIERTAKQYKADYVLIDMNPSLSSFNQNLLMTSEYFIVPTNPDSYSVMAIDSLANVLPKWHSWAQRAKSLPILKEAVYPFPNVTPKFLGTIIQNYRPREGRPAKAFEIWIEQINERVVSRLVPELRKSNMVLPEDMYSIIDEEYCLASIPDFNSLIAKSQTHRTPVFALSDEELDQAGSVLETTKRSQKRFRLLFSDMADNIIQLTDDANSD